MSTLTMAARRFVHDEQGATTAEYGIILVVIAGIAIAVLATLNVTMTTLYDKFTNKVNAVN